MNILHTEVLMRWGGEQNKVINEMLFMRELGHNVMLLANEGSQISQRASELGFKVFCQPLSKKTYHKSIPAVFKIVKENNINLLISHGSVDSWVCAIAGLFVRPKGVKLARERHNLFPIKGFISRFSYKHLFDNVFYISNSIKDYLLEIGVSQEKLVNMPSTINVSKFESGTSTLRQELKSKLCIGTLTSLYKEKGVYELAHAAKALIDELDCDFIFGGDIEESVKNEILEILGEKRAKKAIITGFRSDNVNIIKACDIFIFPSHSEGLGTALLEAMASKRAIVTFNLAPMNDLIKHEERGLCAKCFEADDLVRNVMRYVNEPDLAQNCAKNAYEYVRLNYDESVLKEKIKEYLNTINQA